MRQVFVRDKRIMKKKRKIHKNTFTKIWMNRLLWFCCLWISASYLLAAFGYSEIAETLSQTACTVIIGTVIPYFLKSFFETKEEKKNEMKINELNCQLQPRLDELNITDLNNDEAVG